MEMNKRTDLAIEEHELWKQSAGETTELPGVIARDKTINGVDMTIVEIIDERGMKALHKPEGCYLTLDLMPFRRRERDAFDRSANVIAVQLRELLSLSENCSVLVVGLGNTSVTPDAIGPKTLEHLLITRHLRARVPEHFSAFRPVCAVAPGVLGTTGLESVEVVRGVISHAKPDRVIVIDALAACNPDRLCCTVQLSNAGIIPGSGVGNSREGFDQKSLGIPVVSIGVPTVVDAKTLVSDTVERYGGECRTEEITSNMIVTPTDIDASIRDLSRLLGCAINLAMHEQLTAEEISYFVG